MKKYNDIQNLQQIDKKQLYIGDNIYLISYRTIIGILIDGVWHVTTQKYSPTTSKQISQFSRNHIIKRIEQADLENLLQE